MSLATKSQKWVDNMLISAQQRTAILDYEKKNGNRNIWNVAYIFASLLIGLGVILLIAANWSAIPAAIKLLGDFALLGALFYGVYWSLINKKPIMRECFTILSFAMIGGSIGLIGQIYHLNGGWQSLALFWALLSLPFVLISRAKLLSAVWIWLLLTAVDSEVWYALSKFFFREFTLNNVLSIIGLYAIYYGLEKLGQKIKDVIVLPTALAKLALIFCYIIVGFVGMIWGLLEKGVPAQTFGAYAVVFGFLAFRMYAAVLQQNMKSFQTNAIWTEIYIFAIFLFRLDSLWRSGIGFVVCGLLILGFLWLLRRTISFIKSMEVFR